MEKESLRIVFMGTPEFAVKTLEALVDGGYNVVAVVTGPDKSVGRHQSELKPSSVKQYALSKGLPLLQPEKLKDENFLKALKEYKADLQIVVAFRLLPEEVWGMPRFGTFNVHAALLPQYRGAAPINWAVINGETLTGVTTFFIDKDIDTGRIILQKTLEISHEDDAGKVHDELMLLGADIAIETVDKIIKGDGRVEALPQDEILTPNKVLNKAPKIFKETCQISWEKDDKTIYNLIRGLSPSPGAWTLMTTPKGEKLTLKIFKSSLSLTPSDNLKPGSIVVNKNEIYVATTTNFLRLEELQQVGKKRMPAKAFLNGFRDIENNRLES